MIFVSLGTQVFQFDRLTKKLDELVSKGQVREKVVAQIGSANYIPQNYEYKKFMDNVEFSKYQDEADLIITHGGTGAIISASKKGKNIIAVPRLAEFNEHVDDHQLQIVKVLSAEGYIRAVYDMDDLGDAIVNALKSPITKPYQRESNIINLVENFIDNL